MPLKKVQVQSKRNQYLKDTKIISRVIGNNFRTRQQQQKKRKYVVYENCDEKELALPLKAVTKELPSSADTKQQWTKHLSYAIIFLIHTTMVAILR